MCRQSVEAAIFKNRLFLMMLFAFFPFPCRTAKPITQCNKFLSRFIIILEQKFNCNSFISRSFAFFCRYSTPTLVSMYTASKLTMFFIFQTISEKLKNNCHSIDKIFVVTYSALPFIHIVFCVKKLQMRIIRGQEKEIQFTLHCAKARLIFKHGGQVCR